MIKFSIFRSPYMVILLLSALLEKDGSRFYLWIISDCITVRSWLLPWFIILFNLLIITGEDFLLSVTSFYSYFGRYLSRTRWALTTWSGVPSFDFPSFIDVPLNVCCLDGTIYSFFALTYWVIPRFWFYSYPNIWILLSYNWDPTN